MSHSCSHCSSPGGAHDVMCDQCGHALETTTSANPAVPFPPPGTATMPPPNAPDSPWAPGSTQEFALPATPPPPPAPAPPPNPDGGTASASVPYLPAQAPVAPPAPPPHPAGVYGPPTFEQVASSTDAPADTGRRSGRGRTLAIAGSILGLGAAALAGIAFVTGRDDLAGGADAPDAAITEMAEAIDDGDVLAAVGLIAPDELSGADAFVEKLIPYIEELSDEFGDDSARVSTDGIGFDIDLEAVDVEVEPRGEHAAIVSFAIVGEVAADGSESAIISDELLAQTGADQDFTTEFDSRVAGDGFDGEDIELVTIEIDGAWYISPFLSAGHLWVESEGLPGGEFELVGEERPGAAADPVAAVESYYEASRNGDIAAMTASLGGGEGRFFHVFDRALVASGAVGDAGGFADGAVADVEYTLTEIDDDRVEIDDVQISFDDGFDETIRITMSDGCGTVESYGERLAGCFSELFPPGAEVDDTLWFQTVEEDGGYRVVVLPTLFDMLSRFVGPYDADTIRWALGFAHTDDPRPAALDERIDIDFDGRRYVVHEFDVEAGTYEIAVDGDHGYDVYLDHGSGGGRFSEGWAWDDRVETYGSTTMRVVVNSAVVDDCRGFRCVPSGDGTTSLTVSETEPVSEPITEPWDDDEVVFEPSFDEEFVDESGMFDDPRLSGSLVWETIVVDGPTTYELALPAGSYDTWTTASNDVDVRVTIPGADCDDAFSFVGCSFEHAGGPVSVSFEIESAASAETVTLAIDASRLTNLVVLDSSIVQLGTEGRVIPFEEVPAGPVIVVAQGFDDQDLVLSVTDQSSCSDVDSRLSEGEACLVQHPGGTLNVEVEGWSDADASGEVQLSVEVAG